MKVKWQIGRLDSFGVPVILFLDEPALAGFGSSAFVGVSRELIQQLLKEVIDAVHQMGALAGVHVCANTDWNLAFQSSVDIINFDAYSYFDKFALYTKEFQAFVEQNRIIAWGMVPTNDTELIHQATAENLAQRWFKSIEPLITTDMTAKRILRQSIFTPSCGCGTLPEEEAERVVVLTSALSDIMKNYL
jgi:methionine synthase II (cobalamin-independent)